MKQIFALVTAVVVALTGCANGSTDPYSGSTANTIIAVAYGTVEQVQQVKTQGDYGKDSLIGGALGLLAASTGSTATQVAGAAGGALLGALFAKSETSTADKYTVLLNNGNSIAMVTEPKNISQGDCVSVEQGEHANIRSVSRSYCTTPPEHPAYPAMHAAAQGAAGDCQSAKQMVLNASTEQQADIATRKMQALCDN